MKKIILCIVILGSLFINYVNVFATDIGEGTTNTYNGTYSESCKDYCFNLGTIGMRVSLIGEDGAKVKDTNIVEYWFYKPEATDYNYKWLNACLSGRTNNTYFTGDSLYLDSPDSVTITKKSGCPSQGNFKSIKSLFDDDSILKDMQGGWSSGYIGAANGLNTRIPNSVNTIVKRIMANIGTDEDTNDKMNNPNYRYENQPNLYSTRFFYVNKILKELGTDYELSYDEKNKKITSNIKSTYYIQIEPLVQYGNYQKYNSNQNYIFYGTISDYKKKYTSGYIKNDFKNIPAFWQQYGSGISSTDYFPKSKFVAFNSNYGNTTNFTYVYNQKGDKYYATGVSFISLSDYSSDDVPDCNVGAREVLKSNEKDYTQEKFTNTVLKDKEKYANVIKECFTNDGLDTEKCPLLAKDFIDTVGIIDEKNEKINICQKKLECSTILDNMEYKFESTKPYKEVDLPATYDKAKASELPTDYDRAIYYLKTHSNIFSGTPSTDKLNYYIYKGIYNKKASCEEITNCPPPETTVNCNTSNSFTFKDNESDEYKCVKEGIAYNDGNIKDKDSITYIQKSMDPEYGTDTNPGKCYEEVSFNFPKDASGKKIKAGILFKWGSDESSLNNTFGTMTVKRKCYVNGSKERTFTTNWAEVKGKSTFKANNSPNGTDDTARINPIITLNYKEAMPKGYEKDPINQELNVYLSSITIQSNIQSNVGEKYITNYNADGTLTKDYGSQDPREYKCTKNCDDLSYIDMEATYQITYTDNLKWYANKSNYGEYTTADNKDIFEDYSNNKVNSEYVLLGYGLPTSFITPTNLEKIDKDKEIKTYGYSLKSDSSKGELSITIKNIGTKNTDSATQYHFSKLMKFNLSDDEGSTGDSKDDVVYSCGFGIYNQLFGYEDGPCTENCDTTTAPEGMDVVFRTVELMDDDSDGSIDIAFPGRIGEGRKLGENWSQLSNENLYEILRNDIYEQETPLYHINLTPEKIQEIREDNQTSYRANKLDPYTYMGEIDENHKYGYKKFDGEVNDLLVFDIDGDGKISTIDAQQTLSYGDSDCRTYKNQQICGKKLSDIVLRVSTLRASVVAGSRLADDRDIEREILPLIFAADEECVFDLNGDGYVDNIDASSGLTDDKCVTYQGETICGNDLNNMITTLYPQIVNKIIKVNCSVKTNTFTYPYTHPYAASYYLDELKRKGWLDGSCMTDFAEDRLNKYSQTGGCRPINLTE